MSLTGSLSNALSGLTAASRSVEVVSSNVANAMSEGYARREIVLASEAVDGSGSGVTIVGVTRDVDERVLADLREASANVANSATQADAWTRVADAIGYPTEEGSLSDRIDTLEASLITAASRPEDTSRLETAVANAGSLAEGIRSVASDIQQMRMDADSDIAEMVDQLNTSLQQVQTLNWQIFQMRNGGQDTSALLDQRQQIVDAISEIVPVRQVAREGSQIALYAPGGAALIDGPAGVLSFERTPTIVAQMTVENGLLSGLELNGQPLDLESRYGAIDGGRLAAAFHVRDSIATTAQASVDAFARDLIERFQDTGLDDSIIAGGAGLFTNGGSAFDSADELGIAGRIEVNTQVDPQSGGDAWRLRDGIGEATPGETGDSELLSALAQRLAESRTTASGPSAGLQRSALGLASDVLSTISSNADIFEQSQAFHAAREEALSYAMAESGVDTDDEMQKLLMIEQVYAANAQVIQTIETLIQQLMEI